MKSRKVPALTWITQGVFVATTVGKRLTFADMDTSITIRVDQKTKDKLEKAAKKDGRTLSNYLRRILEKL